MMSKIKIIADNNIQLEAEGNDSFVQQERKAFIDMISDKHTVQSVKALQEVVTPTEETATIQSDVVVIYDNEGIPSIMRRFRKVTNKELFGGSNKTHAAFIIGGEEYGEIYISIYPNTMINGKPYSLPYQKPCTDITNDDAATACFSKGDGWHMLTAAEWGLLADISLKNGTLPHGNTNNGSYHADASESGVKYDNGHGRTLTGSGPATWTHDHTIEGVHDLCGNVWEMVRGLRIKDGELQAAENNDAAMNIDLTKNGNAWKPLIEPQSGKSIKVSVDEVIQFTTDTPKCGYDGAEWDDIGTKIGYTEQMKELALFPGEPNAYFYADSTEGEYFPLRGGSWSNTSYAGVFYSSLNNPRSSSYANYGFRSAFFRKTEN